MLVLMLMNLPISYAQSTSRQLEELTFTDSYIREVPVSGTVRAGIFIGNPRDTIQNGTFFVKLPTINTSKLCIDIVSRDGRYSAAIKYDIQNLLSGIYELPVLKKYKNSLNHVQQYKSGDIAVLASLKENCNSTTKGFVPVRWDRPNFDDDLIILINSTNAFETSITWIDGRDTNHKSKCLKLKGAEYVAFDTLCKLTGKQADDARALKLERNNFISKEPTISINIIKEDE